MARVRASATVAVAADGIAAVVLRAAAIVAVVAVTAARAGREDSPLPHGRGSVMSGTEPRA